jgi:outer membrane protein TolC
MRQVKQAAEASAELARRMAQVGNFNKLQQAREQGFYADAALNLARAEQQQRATRERLTRLLGLWGDADRSSPARAPARPAAPPRELPDIERWRWPSGWTCRAPSWRRADRPQPGPDAHHALRQRAGTGPDAQQQQRAPTQRGWEIGFELPLFDWGGARVARAEGIYMQTLHRAAETAINARSEVREAYTAYRSAYDIATHQRDEIVPLKAAHRRGEPASLQRHADRRVRTAGRRARRSPASTPPSRRCATSGSRRPTSTWR